MRSGILLSHLRKHPSVHIHRTSLICLQMCCLLDASTARWCSEIGVSCVRVLSAKLVRSCPRRKAASTGEQSKVGKAAQSIHNSPRVPPKISLPSQAGSLTACVGCCICHLCNEDFNKEPLLKSQCSARPMFPSREALLRDEVLAPRLSNHLKLQCRMKLCCCRFVRISNGKDLGERQ